MINKKLLAASYIYRFTMDADVQHCRWLTVSEAEVMELTAKKRLENNKGKFERIGFS
jgi:trk system potassium uptake protein TrkA